MSYVKKLIRYFNKCYESKTYHEWTENEFLVILDHFFYTSYDENKFRYAMLQAVETYPRDCAIMIYLSKYYCLKKNYKKSMRIISSKNIDIAPEYEGPICALKGDIYRAMRHYDTAIKWYRKAMNFEESRMSAYHLAHCYYSLGHYDKALEYFKTFYRMIPEEKLSEADDVIYDMNKCWEKLGNSQDAVNFYQSLVYGSQPFSAAAWFSLAVNYLVLNNYKEAERALKYSVAINPDSSSAYFNLGNIYSQTGQYDLSAKMYDEVIRLEGEDSLTVLYKGESLYYAGRLNDAIKCFHKSLFLNSGSAEANYWLAQCYYVMYDNKKSMQYVEKAIRIDSSNPDYYNLRGNLRMLAEDNVGARIDLSKSVSLQPSNADNVIDYVHFLISTGEPKESMEPLYEAIQINPNDARLHFLVGISEYYRGAKQEAYVSIANTISTFNFDSDTADAINAKKNIIQDIRDYYPDLLEDSNMREVLGDFMNLNQS